MSPDTPLEVLKHHGEVRQEARSDLPDYGNQAQGVWAPKTKSMQELGLDLPEFGPGTMASEIGHIPADGGEFLEFLKDFRRIVEGPEGVPEKIEAVQELGDDTPEYQEFLNKLGDEFPESFFAKKLQAISGIGEATARELFRNGFHSLEELCAAEDEAILDVPGIGKGTLRSIRSHCKESA